MPVNGFTVFILSTDSSKYSRELTASSGALLTERNSAHNPSTECRKIKFEYFANKETQTHTHTHTHTNTTHKHTVHLCVSCDSHYKHRILLHVSLTY